MIEIHLKFSSLSRQQILIATLRIRKVCEASVEIFFARKLPLILTKDFLSFLEKLLLDVLVCNIGEQASAIGFY